MSFSDKSAAELSPASHAGMAGLQASASSAATILHLQMHKMHTRKPKLTRPSALLFGLLLSVGALFAWPNSTKLVDNVRLKPETIAPKADVQAAKADAPPLKEPELRTHAASVTASETDAFLKSRLETQLRAYSWKVSALSGVFVSPGIPVETPHQITQPGTLAKVNTPDLAQEARASEVSELKIAVLEGENGVNIVKKKTAVRPVVEVRDKNNLPVAGATVVFALPNYGATASFAHGAKMLTLVTNSAGHVTVTGMQPIGTGGFKIGITASFHGQVATAAISQTNYLTVAAAQAAGASGGAAGAGGGAGGAGGAAAGGAAGGGLSGAAIGGIVVGVAVAVGVVAGVAVNRGGANSPAMPAIRTGTIGLGSGAIFGPPH